MLVNMAQNISYFSKSGTLKTSEKPLKGSNCSYLLQQTVHIDIMLSHETLLAQLCVCFVDCRRMCVRLASTAYKLRHVSHCHFHA